MADTWIAFARTGNPNNPAIPHWPEYDPKARANLMFNTASRVVNDFSGQTREFWSKI
jgi:para-nitrobenzyl esterase